MIQEDLFSGMDDFSITYTSDGKVNLDPIAHYHDSYELDLFIRADIQIFVGDTKYHIQDGDLLLINAFDIHRIFYNPSHEYTRYVLQFKKSFISDQLNVLQLGPMLKDLHKKRNKRVKLDIRQRVQIEDRLKTLLQLYSQSTFQEQNPITIANIKLELIQLLLQYYNLSESQPLTRPRSLHDTLVREIITYIDEHYQESIQLDDLADQLNKSKYYISHVFRESTRFTIIEYLQYRRVVEAQKMLVDPSASIIDVGFDCGFQNLQHFYRVFKKISGKTPAQYRKLKS